MRQVGVRKEWGEREELENSSNSILVVRFDSSFLLYSPVEFLLPLSPAVVSHPP